MDKQEIEQLIRYHDGHLSQTGYLLSQEARMMEIKTVEALRELGETK